MLVALVACGCEAPAVERASPPGSAALTDEAFAALSASLSGEPGFFDTDNLISNERSYLHGVGTLRARVARNGAYVGVGPGQNFSYIAVTRPAYAFIVDIRRDNALQHLLFKALFELSPTRIEYLSALVGADPPADPDAWRDRDLDALVARVDSAPRSVAVQGALRARIDSAVAAAGIPLGREDIGTIRRFHEAFMRDGLSLRFNSFGRAPRPQYPTLRQLLLERDVSGERENFLVSSERYGTVRRMQLENRIVPVVGDLAGPHALRAVGAWLAERDLAVTALYTSNVEFYLFRNRTFDRFAANVASLPRAEGAVIIRSYFPNFRGRHPLAVPGYFSTQLVQPMDVFVDAAESGGFRDYWDVVTRGVLNPRKGTGTDG